MASPPRGPADRTPDADRRERLVIGAAASLAALILWETASRAGLLSPLFASSPSAILRTGAAMAASGELSEHLWASGREFLLGYALAAVAGVALGLAIGWYRRLRFALDPFVSALYATPRVALLPLVILWLGVGLWSKVAVVALGAVFPVLVNTSAGVRTVDPALVRVARSFRASESRLFRTVVLPAAIPFVVAGLRLGVGRALVSVVVAELYAASAGVGFMLMLAGATFQTDRVFVGLAVLAAFGLVCDLSLGMLERRLERWRPRIELG